MTLHEASPADLDDFLTLGGRLVSALTDLHGPVHAQTCGCGPAERGTIDVDGARWQWWSHWFGVCFERQSDALRVDTESNGGDDRIIDPWRLCLYLRSRHRVDWEVTDALAWLDSVVAGGAVAEVTAPGTRPGLRRFRRC